MRQRHSAMAETNETCNGNMITKSAWLCQRPGGRLRDICRTKWTLGCSAGLCVAADDENDARAGLRPGNDIKRKVSRRAAARKTTQARSKRGPF